jgi:hypothetical protein
MKKYIDVLYWVFLIVGLLVIVGGVYVILRNFGIV